MFSNHEKILGEEQHKRCIYNLPINHDIELVFGICRLKNYA